MAESRVQPIGPQRPRDLAVVGHVNIDRFMDVSNLPDRDRTVPVEKQRVELGGTASTIARVASRLGLSVALISRVGEDFPHRFRQALQDDGLDLTGLETVAHSHSPTCFIVEDGKGDQMTLIDQGPMGNAAHAPIPTNVLRTTAWVHLTTGDPDYILRVKESARSLGCRVSVDPAQEIHYRWGRRDLERLMDGAEIFFANQSEADRAVELLGLGDVGALVDRVPLAVVTRGRRGAVAYSRAGVAHGTSHANGRPGRVTGAGDAFRGGFYSAWLGGDPLPRCLDRGCREAARWIRMLPPEDSTKSSRSRPPRRSR